LQHLYNLPDSELEDQVNDRLPKALFRSLRGQIIGQRCRISQGRSAWRFKEALIKEGVMDSLFELIVGGIEKKGLLVKKGTIVDASIEPVNDQAVEREETQGTRRKPFIAD